MDKTRPESPGGRAEVFRAVQRAVAGEPKQKAESFMIRTCRVIWSCSEAEGSEDLEKRAQRIISLPESASAASAEESVLTIF
ncbi:hypothetical protein JTE90_020070 [Oedothorax gibbosus]|uniref:Uncharacterized protein n=1 Tax=Oedothorax gibbosus TaxID=931172 RepID=A0AAV6UVC4_9ARAC|nr:hypothetical protein JTE90_020070 [Oedothorax gibbosus]